MAAEQSNMKGCDVGLQRLGCLAVRRRDWCCSPVGFIHWDDVFWPLYQSQFCHKPEKNVVWKAGINPVIGKVVPHPVWHMLIYGTSGITVCNSALCFVSEVTASREPKFCIKNRVDLCLHAFTEVVFQGGSKFSSSYFMYLPIGRRVWPISLFWVVCLYVWLLLLSPLRWDT